MQQLGERAIEREPEQQQRERVSESRSSSSSARERARAGAAAADPAGMDAAAEGASHGGRAAVEMSPAVPALR